MIKNFKDKDKAQTMVEFALVLPILMMLIFGLLEVGRMVFVYVTVTTASREAVRYGSATGEVAIGNNLSRYKDCDNISLAAQKVDFLEVISNITISYDNPPDNNIIYECPNFPSDDEINNIDHDPVRIIVSVSGKFIPIVSFPGFTERTFTSTSAHTILGKVTLLNPTITPLPPYCQVGHSGSIPAITVKIGKEGYSDWTILNYSNKSLYISNISITWTPQTNLRLIDISLRGVSIFSGLQYASPFTTSNATKTWALPKSFIPGSPSSNVLRLTFKNVAGNTAYTVTPVVVITIPHDPCPGNDDLVVNSSIIP